MASVELMNPCPLCHNPGTGDDYFEAITVGSHASVPFPFCSIRCNRCGLSIDVFWKVDENGRPILGPLPKELLQPAIDEAKRRWNAIPRAPVPYDLGGA